MQKKKKKPHPSLAADSIDFPFHIQDTAFVEPQILAADDPQIAHNASADVQSSKARRCT
jgi:hypothetical protein